MNLSKDKSIFRRKIVSCLLFCLLLFNVTFANNIPITPLDVESIDMPKSEPPMAGMTYHISKGPINIPYDDSKKNEFRDKRRNVTFTAGQIASDYSGIDGPLIQYYNEQVAIYGSLSNYHEENYIYSNGQHGVSYYDGVLTGIIKDFDGDSMPELAIFKIRTIDVDEFSNKEIILEMIRMTNGMVSKTDEMVISSEQYIGEEIECSIATKYVNDMWRIYLNYYEKKVREQQYENKFIALEYPNVLNVIASLNMSANEDDYEESFDFQDQVIDAGINLREDGSIYKRCFINDDTGVHPIFTIKRVNEKIKDGFVEDYFEQHSDEMNEEGYIKLRYGYTQFIERK